MTTHQLGLKANWQQFSILVVINAFVGAMVGLERNILPEFAESTFGITSNAAILSFIVAFGITKAITNYFTGKLANRWGRKNLLILGWIFAIPIPFLLIYAPSWNWIIAANIFLGINQGLAWSSTVVMKIDLVGEKDRGLAMGLNEFSGYLAVGLMALLSAYVASTYGINPYTLFIYFGLIVWGLFASVFLVKDTRHLVKQEQKSSTQKKLDNVFIHTSFKDKALSSITQAGMINNLNDGMIWGLLPILLLSYKYSDQQIGIATALYPLVWGIGQLFTGKMGDVYSKKTMLFIGMLAQGLVILLLPASTNFYIVSAISIILGIGTALVYPTFLSSIAQVTSPEQRAESIGVFRLWRDLGYAIGAITSGIIADVFGLEMAIITIGIITVLSSLVIKFRMPKI